MNDDERIRLIRKGNELFNQGNIEKAAKIFLETNYIDGIVRVGDYYYYDQKKIFKAFFFYRKANYKKRLDEIYQKMANIVHLILEEDTIEYSSNDTEQLPQTSGDKVIKKYEFPKIT